jgi:hypothetical protein
MCLKFNIIIYLHVCVYLECHNIIRQTPVRPHMLDYFAILYPKIKKYVTIIKIPHSDFGSHYLLPLHYKSKPDNEIEFILLSKLIFTYFSDN